MAREDTAPKPRAATPPKDTAKEKPTGRPPGRANAASVGKIEEGLTDLFTGLALVAQAGGNDIAFVVLTSRGPKLARAWAELARQNASVRRVIERLMTGGAWGGVIMSSVSVAMPLAASYGVTLPPPLALAGSMFQLTPEEYAEAMQLRTMREQVASDFANANQNGNNGGGADTE